MTTHPDELAFLSSICETPADDTTRLMYADWLDEHGRPERAEFIRVQIELAKVPAPALKTVRSISPGVADYPGGLCPPCQGAAPERCIYHRLAIRSDELVEHADEWVPRVNALWDWHRGFVRRIDGVTSADWLGHGDAIRASHPVERVTLTTWPGFERRPRGRVRLPGRTVELAVGTGRLYSDAIPDLLAAEWPGIAFDLPDPLATTAGLYEAPITWTNIETDPAQLTQLQQLAAMGLVSYETIVQQFGLPAALIDEAANQNLAAAMVDAQTLQPGHVETPPVTDEQWQQMTEDILRGLD